MLISISHTIIISIPPSVRLVEAQFRVVEVAAVGDGVVGGDKGEVLVADRLRRGRKREVAPRVVDVVRQRRARFIRHAQHVALDVLDVVIRMLVHRKADRRVVRVRILAVAMRIPVSLLTDFYGMQRDIFRIAKRFQFAFFFKFMCHIAHCIKQHVLIIVNIIPIQKSSSICADPFVGRRG